ncbi:basic amino acid/polyamine antiporter, APA family [Saccharopolyspora antimicrobica]|uniref:APA family basic amino acid/polyamine antiporter n=1 Tax=Saccharopolyspora antimicrobica TaxID=455193 RepID=A0A1I5JFT0_9PSEU|nr:APC family permease [Saccharopolyspora antimicrobica]RKT82511.1 APA family basic amino acid/polyamine antiporter [Saccharopolyspora antimicrobica]SFO71423.1 basic amino acid/polyamine antiporter, APA family [Saccharopolyspora antimicrobica]
MAQQVESSGRLASGAGAVPLALGGMLGVGVLVGPAPAAAAAGMWAPFGLLIALLAAVCSATATAYQSAAYRGPGAVYACVRGRMGVLPARVGASAYLAGHIAAMAAIARVLGDFFLPASAPLVAAAAILLVVLSATTGLRIRGAAAWIWLALTAAVLALVVVTCFAIAPVPPLPTGASPADSAVGITGAAGVLFFAFLGFERLTAPAEERDRVPWAAVKRGVVISFVLLTAVLAVVTAALVHQLGWSRLALSPTPIRDVLTAAAASELAPLVSVGAAVALLPVLLAGLESIRSTALALVQEGDLPQGLGRRSGAGTPYLLDVGAGVAAVAVALLVDPVTAMAFAACSLLVHYAFANAGARLLLADAGGWPMRAACLGMGVSVVIAMSMPISAMLATLVVVFIGPLATGGVSRRWR